MAVPALRIGFELALGRAAGVVVEVQQPRVAVLPFLHARVSAYLAVALLEALVSLEAQRLPDGGLAAAGEVLWTAEEDRWVLTRRQQFVLKHFPMHKGKDGRFSSFLKSNVHLRHY